LGAGGKTAGLRPNLELSWRPERPGDGGDRRNQLTWGFAAAKSWPQTTAAELRLAGAAPKPSAPDVPPNRWIADLDVTISGNNPIPNLRRAIFECSSASSAILLARRSFPPNELFAKVAAELGGRLPKCPSPFSSNRGVPHAQRVFTCIECTATFYPFLGAGGTREAPARAEGQSTGSYFENHAAMCARQRRCTRNRFSRFGRFPRAPGQKSLHAKKMGGST